MASVPLSVVDAHVHFWDPAALDYPWLAEVPPIERACLPDAYRAAAADVPVQRVVFVECNCLPEQGAREVAFVEGLVADEPRIGGVVAFADIAAHGAAALDALPPSPLVKGVRQNIQGQPAGYCLTPSFVEGVRGAGRRGLPFDVCVTHDQLADVLALVERCADTRFVLDHCGKPAIRSGLIDAWASDVTSLASHDNVVCKLSGLLTEAGAGWRAADLAPYAEHVAAQFGPARLLYGSDWPVLTLAGRYDDWYAFTERLTADWSDGDRRAFYGENAVRVYGL
jgi:L-fuconolactonase